MVMSFRSRSLSSHPVRTRAVPSNQGGMASRGGSARARSLLQQMLAEIPNSWRRCVGSGIPVRMPRLRERREIVFRQAGQPDHVVPLVTPYIELPSRIERDGHAWAYAAQEGERPIFQPIDELNLEDFRTVAPKRG